MSIKEMVVGGALTLVIGGTAYTVNQQDVVDNFANDTGLSEQQAQEYVDNIKQEDLVTYDKLGNSYIEDGNTVLQTAKEIDCVTYEYEWVTPTLSCELGKSQLNELGIDEVALGKAYITLSGNSANEADINTTIRLLDEVNSGLDTEIVVKILDFATIDENKKTNSYNKSLLQAALQSNQ